MQNHIKINDSIKIGHSHMRPRRLRLNSHIRAMVQENVLKKSNLVLPLFITECETQKTEIKSLPGVFRIPQADLIEEIRQAYSVGIRNIMLFPVIKKEKKDLTATEAYNENGFLQQCIRQIKQLFQDLVIFVDVALDPYTLHGHDGITNEAGYVLNDVTVEALCRQALSYAQCGVDFVSPSDMMDGRIGAIRNYLDTHGFINTGILAYSAKFASSFYGPFREAVNSGARNLDKKNYQLNFANSREAMRECALDIAEGADIIMIKPGLPYLDIVAKVKEISEVPIAVYQVSGEYTMLKLAVQNNILDEKSAVEESLMCIKRAGADLIVTYYAKWACENLPNIV